MAGGNFGGKAVQTGIYDQNSLATYLAVQILAERDWPAQWNLPQDTVLDSLTSESDYSVDDIVLRTSYEGFIFIQAKDGLKANKSHKSELFSAIAQMVGQFRSGCFTKYPQVRPLDVERDRLVIVTTSRSSLSIRNDIPEVLSFLKGNPDYSPSTVCHATELSQAKRDKFDVLLNHAKRAWNIQTQNDPTEEDLNAFFELLWLSVVDVEEDSRAKAEAITILKRSVILDQAQAGAAWSVLYDFISNKACLRSGINRKSLHYELMINSIRLQSTPSYRNDISRLKNINAQNRDLLQDYSYIDIPTGNLEVPRPSIEALIKAIDNCSFLITGDAGIGKSGVLCKICQALEAKGQEYLLLNADDIDAGNTNVLARQWGLDHDLPEALENWFGKGNAYLLIDGLDALRTEACQKTLRDLIRLTMKQQNRWTVIATIRRFDLRYSDFKDLFKGRPICPEFASEEFNGVCHFHVPGLGNEEFDYIYRSVPQLRKVMACSSDQFIELLKNLFNLRIMLDLLDEGADVSGLQAADTQVELLNKYWEYRILRGKRNYEKEKFLHDICETMLKNRSLKVNRWDIKNKVFNGDIMGGLHNSHVIKEWENSTGNQVDRDTICFAHHILFDYAVFKLLLSSREPGEITDWLKAEADLNIMIRPSINYYFKDLWTRNINDFWHAVFHFISSYGLSELAKIIGPSVAAEMARDIDDFQYLLDQITKGVEVKSILQYLIQGLGSGCARLPLVGDGAGPWCALAGRLSENLSGDIPFYTQSLLKELLNQPNTLTTEQKQAAGLAARESLSCFWTLHQQDSIRGRRFIAMGITSVCRTYDSDPDDSQSLLLKCFEEDHFNRNAYFEIPCLAEEARYLINIAPAFVIEIYKQAFGHNIESSDSYPMGSSQILALTESKKQAYEYAHYLLSELFPDFMEIAPAEATLSLIFVMESYVVEKGMQYEEFRFNYEDSQAGYISDLSFIWDSPRSHRYDEKLKALDAFERFLDNAQRANRNEVIDKVISVVVNNNRMAVIWKKLLQLGIKHPQTFGMKIRCLAWAYPILYNPETSYEAGEFLKKIFSLLEPAEKEKIEALIIGMTGDTRNRLLSCLPLTEVICENTESQLQMLYVYDLLIANKAPVTFTFEIIDELYTEEDYLKDHGIDIDQPDSIGFRKILNPIKEFSKTFSNSVPTVADIVRVMPHIHELYSSIYSEIFSGPETELYIYACDVLAEACSCIVKADLTDDYELRKKILSILIDIIQDTSIKTEYFNENFDRRPSWPLPAPRIRAAAALVNLAKFPDCIDEQVKSIIRELSQDTDKPIRLQVAGNILSLSSTSPELMWTIIERMSEEEPSTGVLGGLITPLSELIKIDKDRTLLCQRKIFQRIKKGPESRGIDDWCSRSFCDYFLFYEEPVSTAIVMEAIANPENKPDAVQGIVMEACEYIALGLNVPESRKNKEVRHRAIGLLPPIIENVFSMLKILETRYHNIPIEQWPEEERETGQTLYHVLDILATRIYATSGALDANTRDKESQRVLTDSEKKQFFNEIEPVADKLAETRFPAIIYHLNEMLFYFAPIDPERMFNKICQYTGQGKDSNYQHESLAMNLLQKMVQTYLADYRYIFQAEECRLNLVNILELFVNAGWTSAMTLLYKMEEIFR